MANENFIDQVVTPEAEAGVVSLKAQLADLNQQFIDTARGAATLLAATGNATSLRALNTESARAAQATERLNGIQLRNQITQERLNQTVARGVQAQERQTAAVQRALSPYEQLNKQHIAARNSARDLAVQYGLTDQRTIAATATANGFERQLRAVDTSLGQSQRNVGNYGSAFTKLYGYIRTAANILPGVGISGIFLAAFEGLSQVSSALGIFSSSSKQAQTAYEKFLTSVSETAAKEQVELDALYKASQNVNIPLADRKKIVDQLQEQYPGYFGNLKDEAILAGKAASAYNELSDSIVNKALVSAAEKNIQDAAKPLTEFILTQKQAIVDADARAAEYYKRTGKRISNAPIPTFGIQDKTNKNNKGTGVFSGTVEADLESVDEYKNRLQKKIDSAQLTLQKVLEDFGVSGLFDPKKKVKTAKGKTDVQLLDEQLKALKLAQDKILENDQSSFKERFKAVDTYEQSTRVLIDKAEKNKVLSHVEGNNKILAIDIEDKNNREKIQKELNAYYEKLQKELFDSLVRGEKALENEFLQAQNNRLQELDRNKEAQLLIASEQYAKGELNARQYNKRLLDIETESTLQRINVQLASLHKIAEAQAASVALGFGNSDDLQKTVDTIAKLEIDSSNEIAKVKKKNNEEIGKSRKQLAELEQQLALEGFNLVQAIGNNIFESKQAEIENQKKATDEQAEEEKKNVNNSLDTQSNKARRLAIIDAQTAAKQKQLDIESRKLARERAIFEKALSIARIVENTAVGISKTIAELGFPFATPFIVAAAAIGAVQIATVLAQPLPAFAKGVKNFSGGMALVGEEGRERIDTPFGSFLSPDVATAMYLPQGTDVTPHAATMRQIRPENLSGYGKRDIINFDDSRIVRAINNKPIPKQPRRGGYTDVARAIATQDYFRRRGA